MRLLGHQVNLPTIRTAVVPEVDLRSRETRAPAMALADEVSGASPSMLKIAKNSMGGMFSVQINNRKSTGQRLTARGMLARPCCF